MSAERLYTPDLLAAAVELANYPPIENGALRGTARSATCGSTVEMDLACNPDGRIADLGMRVHACAVGQGAATLFARHASGRSLKNIADAERALRAWLENDALAPDWPGLALIAPAREYRGRHGAMLLPWKAALDALSSGPASG